MQIVIPVTQLLQNWKICFLIGNKHLCYIHTYNEVVPNVYEILYKFNDVTINVQADD